MFFAVTFIMAALILYSTAIWSERLNKGLKLWMVIVFSLGFLCDLTGTTLMRVIAGRIILSAHAISGYAALFIMLGHLICAIIAFNRRGRAQAYFTHYSIYAWCFWIVVFILGIPKI